MYKKPVFSEHIGLARHYVKQFTGFLNHENKSIEYDDLFAVALYALHRTCDEFDPARNVKFEYLAAVSMKYAMRNFIINKGDTIRRSWDNKKAVQKVSKLIDDDNDLNDLLESGAIAKDEYNYYKFNFSMSDMPVERVFNDNDDEEQYDDEDYDENLYSVSQSEIEKEELITALLTYIDLLDPKEKLIIEKVYGIGCDKMTKKDVAKEVKINKTYMALKVRKILTKLKKMMENDR